ncbi:hypothetical protein [Providencia rettgeri]|uniref:hypothetical protein n=1 Tax=Providencia rettgeri TaxID=587 RepID=UPI003525E759
MIDKSRQQFEGEFTKRFPYSSDGALDLTIKESFWAFWQASRESLEIELPKKCNISIGGDVKTKYYFNGINEGITKCQDVLISNGVKIK